MKLYELFGIGGNSLGFGGGGASVAPLTLVDANTVSQSNGATAQTFLVYGTVDNVSSPTNYERCRIFDDVPSNVWRFNFEKGGTGTNRGIDFACGGNYSFTNGVGGSRTFIIAPAGTISAYGGVNTSGHGVPAIRSAGRSTAQTAAVASVATYTVSAADSSFEVSANVLVTTATSHAFTVTCAYTDESNTARTVTLNFSLVAGGAFTTSIANANGAVPYLGMPVHIRAKAATTITIATTGTFTTVTYNVEGNIRQLS